VELVLSDELLSPDPECFDPRFVGPRGSNSPDLYVVGEAPGREEAESQLPFVGSAGKILDRAIRLSIGATSNIRFFNAIPYRPITKEGSSTKNRTPTKEEIIRYSVFLKKDIEKTKPKIILLVGRSAMTVFGISSIMTVGTARSRVFLYHGIPTYVAYHPAYVLRDSGWNIITGGTSPSFESLIADINKALSARIKKTVKTDYTVVDVLEWDRVETIFENDSEVVLDYEASGLNTYHHDYFVGGIALEGRTTKARVYVMLYNFWRTPDELTISVKLKARIGVWLLSKKLVCFNLQYECAASLMCFKVYIRDIVDVMMLNRSLGRSGGLKEIAYSRLGIQVWDTEVDEWNDLVVKTIKGLKPTHKGRVRNDVLFIQDNKCNSIDSLISWYDSLKKPTDRITNNRAIFAQVNKIAKKYYNGRYNDFCKRFFDLVLKRAASGDLTVKFTDIPVEIIAPYAIDDVEYTSQLKDVLGAEVQRLDIVRISEVYNNLAKLGFEMESSGIAWDDKLASELDRVYLNKAMDSLRSLLMMPKFQTILPSHSLSTEDKFVPLVDCHQDILEIQTTTDLDNLTKFFNPLSNHKNTRERFAKLIVTGRLRFLMMLHAIFKEYQSGKEECIREYPVLGPTLEQIITEPDTKLRFSMVEALVEGSEGIADKVTNHPKNRSDLWRDDYNKKITPPEIEAFIKYSNWELAGMASEIIEDMYNAFWHIGGINVDDPSTWPDEFRAVYLFRLHKKVMKSYSTYIWGRIGRGNAALLSKTEVHNLCASRSPGWREKAPEDQVWIKETSFSVCTAVTKRFQSGDHTVPGGELIDLRVSRFADGVRLHWDLSQSEIRVLAKIANDRNLLQKFTEGADIHLFIASKIWGKVEKDISSVERRHAKSAVFAVLYGDSPPSFAVKFLNGNVELANYIFNQLFTMFPNIATWIKGQHRLVLEKGHILTYFKDPIYDLGMPNEALALSREDKDVLLENIYSKNVKLSPHKDTDKILRKKVSKSFRNSQNYPIQSVSSTLAGIGEYYLLEYLRDKEMSARVDCFTHDAGEVDLQIADIPRIISVLPRFVIDNVVEEFNIPIKADYEIGISGNRMVKLKDVVIDGAVVCSSFNGTKRTALDDLGSKLTCYGVKVEVTVDNETEVAHSMSELFLAKGAYSLSLGQKERIATGKMKLDFSCVRREA
jgi:uracil-DNA glycosylase